MKFLVNENCIGCGLCTNICPGVFTMDGAQAVASPEGPAPDLEGSALEAMESCPVNAIEKA